MKVKIGSDILGTGHSFYVHIKYNVEASICPWDDIPFEAGITVLTFLYFFFKDLCVCQSMGDSRRHQIPWSWSCRHLRASCLGYCHSVGTFDSTHRATYTLDD